MRPALPKICIACCRVALIAVLLGASACTTPGNDSVAAAEASNVARSTRASEDAADFLVEMVDARRMDYAEGSLALSQATTPELRAYGAEMTRDQTELLAELTRLAAALRVEVPQTIGADKRGPLQSLTMLQGKDFDRRFMSMITIDHERDVKACAAAERLERDPLVANFASRRRPLIQSHLDEIKAIRAAY